MTKICIVEDNAEMRHALSLIIQLTDGYSLEGVYENAEVAMREIPTRQPDVVLMDINLPGSSGIDCVWNLKQAHPKMLFLMCTSYDDNDKIFQSLESGASGYLLKSDGPAKIVEAIADLLDGGSPMSAAIARKVVASFSKIKSDNPALQSLTNREMEILELLSKGLLNKEVADATHTSLGTIRKHVQHIYEKLHVNTRVEAVNKYLKR